MQREAERLEQAGILTSRRVGKSKLVRPNEDSPFYADLASLLRKAFGPVPLLERLLGGVNGVEAAYVFGSWAERHEGRPGPPPNDLDVLVVGDPSRRELARALRSLEQDLGIEVTPTVVAPSDWKARSSAFLRSISQGALVPVTVNRDE